MAGYWGERGTKSGDFTVYGLRVEGHPQDNSRDAKWLEKENEKGRRTRGQRI